MIIIRIFLNAVIMAAEIAAVAGIAALGYTNPGLYKNGLDQIPSWVTWGNAATMFNPGGFDPVPHHTHD